MGRPARSRRSRTTRWSAIVGPAGFLYCHSERTLQRVYAQLKAELFENSFDKKLHCSSTISKNSLGIEAQTRRACLKPTSLQATTCPASPRTPWGSKHRHAGPA
jgi:hypothetical protein